MWSDVELHLSNYHRCIAACPICSNTADGARARLVRRLGLNELRLLVIFKHRHQQVCARLETDKQSYVIKPKYVDPYFIPHPVVSSQTWSLPAEGGKNNQTSPTSKLYKKRLPFVSQPPLVWQMEPRYMSRQSQQPWQYRIRMPPPPKGKAELGPMGECVRDGAPGRAGGWTIDAKQSWQTRCKLSPQTIKHLSQLTVGDVLIDSDSELDGFWETDCLSFKSGCAELPWLTQIRDVTTSDIRAGKRDNKVQWN